MDTKMMQDIALIIQIATFVYLVGLVAFPATILNIATAFLLGILNIIPLWLNVKRYI